MITDMLLHQIDAYELQFKTQPTIQIIKNWIKDLKEKEQSNIIEAYKTSTLDQCKDIGKLFGEKDIEPTTDEMELIDNDAKSFFEKQYAK